MKSTFFAILVLVLMIGLTLVEMNANTQTPFQALSEAEMLTTQGAGACEREKTEFVNAGHCASIACETWWNGLGWSSKRMSGGSKIICGTRSTIKDCFETGENNQLCAEGAQYYGPYCQAWFQTNIVLRAWTMGIFTLPAAGPCTTS